MKFDITKMVEEIAMQAKENQEEFIFETIRPYCENVLQMKINKEELKQILLNSMQKQQSCDDCVSREEAIRIAEQGQIQGFEWQLRKLCTLPSVTPQRPKGKWIHNNCSICGYSVNPWNNTPYCPNCGADMRGENSEVQDDK